MKDELKFLSITIAPNEKLRRIWDELKGLDDIKRKLLAHMEVCLSSHIFSWYERHYKKDDPILPDFDGKTLLIGPPGTGKTSLARGLADAYGRRVGKEVYLVELGLIRSKFVGQTSRNIHLAFEKVKELSVEKPVIFLLDEFDSIANSRSFDQMHEEIRDAVNTLIKEFDRICSDSIYIVACSNLERNIDKAIKRRFDLIIKFQRPNLRERFELLSYWLNPFGLRREVIVELAKKTENYTPAGLKNLVKASLIYAYVKDEPLAMKHLSMALKEVRPTGDTDG